MNLFQIEGSNDNTINLLSNDSLVSFNFSETNLLFDFDNVTNISSFNESLKNGSEIYFPHHTRPDTYIVPIIFALIFIIGIVGK